jgi:hypothetical protein
MANRLNFAICLAFAIIFSITLAAVMPIDAIEATLSGSTVSVTGTASPGEQVSMRSSFTMNLPVSGGQYEYETSVEIPQEPNRFQVTARNVQDFNAGVKMGIWITKRFQANGGTASISHANVPSGRYNIKLFGEAQPGSSQVPIEVAAETQVKADSNGKYSLDIDTSGIPAGEYRIEVAGETKTIQVGGSSPDSSAASSPANTATGISSTASAASQNEDDGTGEEIPDQKAKPVEITSEVIHWYANETGQSIATTGEYQETEKQLRQRIAGGYWKIIRQGDPLTEQAGNCENEFCLIRDKDACTVCRDKDIILKSNQSREAANPVTNNQNRVSQKSNDSKNLDDVKDLNEPQDLNKSQAAKPVQEKGLVEQIGAWANQLFGTHTGG